MSLNRPSSDPAATCDLQTCYNLLKQLGGSLWITSFDNQRATSTDLNYWIKLLSYIIEANGGHIGLSHINLHWYY